MTVSEREITARERKTTVGRDLEIVAVKRSQGTEFRQIFVVLTDSDAVISYPSIGYNTREPTVLFIFFFGKSNNRQDSGTTPRYLPHVNHAALSVRVSVLS